MWTPIILLIAVPLLVAGQDSACPGQTNIVEMCKDNSQTGEIVFLDSATSKDLSGACTCHIKAETSSVDITVNVTTVPTGCLAAMDFPSLALSSFCDRAVPNPVSTTVQPGTDVFASLIRKHSNETTLFCVELRHTNIDTGGQMKVVCRTQSINDVVNKSIVFPSSSSTAESATSEQQQQLSSIQPAASTPAAETPAPGETAAPAATETVQPTSTSDAASADIAVPNPPPPGDAGGGSNVAETQANTVQVVDSAVPGETSQTLMPSMTQDVQESEGNAVANTPVLETSNQPEPTAQPPEQTAQPGQTAAQQQPTAQPPEPTAQPGQTATPPQPQETAVVPSNNPAATADVVETSAVNNPPPAVEETIIPTSSQTQITASQAPQTGANTGQADDAVFVSSLVVGILGGIFLFLVILGIFVHFRDKRHARATSLRAKKSRIREEYENRALVED